MPAATHPGTTRFAPLAALLVVVVAGVLVVVATRGLFAVLQMHVFMTRDPMEPSPPGAPPRPR